MMMGDDSGGSMEDKITLVLVQKGQIYFNPSTFDENRACKILTKYSVLKNVHCYIFAFLLQYFVKIGQIGQPIPDLIEQFRPANI